MEIRYLEIKRQGTKRGLCKLCNRQAERAITISQTLNPFNRNDKDEIKTKEEIIGELTDRIKKWRKEPIYHKKCEDKNE